MDLPCKVCQKTFPIGRLDARAYSGSEVCPHCKHYFVILDTEDTLFAENVIVKNYNLIFLVQCQDASVVENGEEHKIIHSFPMTELTHELAVDWVRKLKTYVVFQ